MDAGDGLETPDASLGDGEPLLERALTSLSVVFVMRQERPGRQDVTSR
jgi:hypothetical protein